MSATCIGYTKTTLSLLVTELGGGRPWLKLDRTIGKAAETAQVSCAVYGVGCRLLLCTVGAWFGFDHIEAYPVVGICVLVYASRTVLAVCNVLHRVDTNCHRPVSRPLGTPPDSISLLDNRPQQGTVFVAAVYGGVTTCAKCTGTAICTLQVLLVV